MNGQSASLKQNSVAVLERIPRKHDRIDPGVFARIAANVECNPACSSARRGHRGGTGSALVRPGDVNACAILLHRRVRKIIGRIGIAVGLLRVFYRDVDRNRRLLIGDRQCARKCVDCRRDGIAVLLVIGDLLQRVVIIGIPLGIRFRQGVYRTDPSVDREARLDKFRTGQEGFKLLPGHVGALRLCHRPVKIEANIRLARGVA